MQIPSLHSYVFYCSQRQAERIKREKAQAKKGDDAAPSVKPDSLVPVNRFQGSRLASGPSPSPYQKSRPGHSSKSSLEVKDAEKLRDGMASAQINAGCKRKWTSDDDETSVRAHKVARYSSGATIGAAIVEAENSLEIDVGLPL